MPSVHGSWTTCTSCSQKSHVHPSHTVHISCAARAAPQQPAASVSPSVTRAARACSFSVSRCGCLGRRNSRGRGEFQCIQLGYWVDGCFGGAGLTVFSCGKHKHTVVQSVLVVQTHTNRLSHFSFFLPANFLHLLFFLPANFLHFSFFLPANFLHLLFSFLQTFCTFHFSFLLTFCTCFFPFFVYFLEPTIYFLEPTIYCLFTFLTYMFNTFATTTWLLKPLSVL